MFNSLKQICCHLSRLLPIGLWVPVSSRVVHFTQVLHPVLTELHKGLNKCLPKWPRGNTQQALSIAAVKVNVRLFRSTREGTNVLSKECSRLENLIFVLCLGCLLRFGYKRNHKQINMWMNVKVVTKYFSVSLCTLGWIEWFHKRYLYANFEGSKVS